MIPKQFCILATVLALAGCSSTPTKVDHGPIHARTFSFVDRGPRTEPAFVDNSQAVHAMIQQAIKTSLASRGVTQVPKGGDVTVGYLLIIGNNASTMAINDYFGYGRDTSGLQDKAHDAYTSSKNPNSFEAGTLVIDIIDSTTFKLLKRGYATRPVLPNISDADRARRIQEAVNEILKDLRIES